MKCPICGTLMVGTSYCPNCGYSLDKDIATNGEDIFDIDDEDSIDDEDESDIKEDE